MAAMALPPPRSEQGPDGVAYARALMTDFDLADNRYPPLGAPARPQSAMVLDNAGWDTASHSDGHQQPPPRRSFDPATAPDSSQLRPQPSMSARSAVSEQQSLRSQPQVSPSNEHTISAVSYGTPQPTPPDFSQQYSSDTPTPAQDPSLADPRSSQVLLARQSQVLNDPPLLMASSSPRHPSLPAAGVGTPQGPVSGSPIIPMSASPSYNPPVSSSPRVQPQQPTYITPVSSPTPVNPVFSPRPPPPQEEVCVECAMRDQDMADVDVTSPGVWERESDAHFEDLKRREMEEELNGIVNDDPNRPRTKGHPLSEKNLKIWLSINPREPSSKHKTLTSYVKAQRSLLEAEALAHAQAMHEAKQLDSRMRDAYSQLRRSAYDMGSSAAPVDDSGGVRIRPPQTPAAPAVQGTPHARGHSRDVTLLENGMIVEHVDVRREEREARDRKRKEERRARKSSRSSVYDVNSIISNQSYVPQTDSGVGLKPYSRYSQASSGRPASVVTNPAERPDIPRAYSQMSFSDINSLSSASPRRSRFFGVKNLSAGWRSQDSLAPSYAASGMSGSMIDMHLALQRESTFAPRGQIPQMDQTAGRRSQVWGPEDLEAEETPMPQRGDMMLDQPKKKKKGLAKIWNKMKGTVSGRQPGITSSRETSQTYERTDDTPLAPPPPLSYLVNRGEQNGRHASTPSLPSSMAPSQKQAGMNMPGMSPPTPPSSILPSPASSRPSEHPDINVDFQLPTAIEEAENDPEDTIGKSQSAGLRNVHPTVSEPDMRQHSQNRPMSVVVPPVPRIPFAQTVMPGSPREKSLPPLPPGEIPVVNERPQTVYSFDPRQLPPGSGPAHTFSGPNPAFRSAEARRQSFGGLTARPQLPMSLPAKQLTMDQRRSFAPRYDEFGASRRSLGNFITEGMRSSSSPVPTKRKSRFGLSSLLGKKQALQNEPSESNGSDYGYNPYPSARHSDPPEEMYGRNSAYGGRTSVASRRPLEELVSQDSEFVAYRYPSQDQRLDLQR